MEKQVLNSMFENLLHIWNKTNFWNAKMKPYIYGSVNGIHVINLLETAKKLEEVKAELAKLSSEGKKVLIVATKIQSRDAFKKLAEDTGSFYVCEKWVPGLLTNFKTIRKRINSYLQLLNDSESGALDMLTKKEKATKLLELEKLNKAYAWLKELKRVPDVILAADGIYEKQALKEAKTLNLSAFAIFNTNGDIDLVSNLIPANTNSVKSFEFLASELKSSFVAAKIERKSSVKKLDTEKVSGDKPKAVRKPRAKKEETNEVQA